MGEVLVIPPEEVGIGIDVVELMVGDDGFAGEGDVAGHADETGVGGEECAVDGGGEGVVGDEGGGVLEAVFKTASLSGGVHGGGVEAYAGGVEVGADPVEESAAFWGIGEAFAAVGEALENFYR